MIDRSLLENQVAIITGSGRGIGRTAALKMAEVGAAVVLVARSNDEISSVAGEIKRRGGQALAIPTDVSDIAQVDHLLVLTLRAFGRVDVLVNNAGLLQPVGKVWETSPAAWRTLIEVNVVGPYLCARAVLPHMLERGSGRLINLSSGVAERNLRGTSAYNTSKAALERFSGTLAAEVEGAGLSVTVLRPGAVDTQMQSQLRQTSVHRFPQVADWQALHEQGHLRSPEEPAWAMVWLASHFAQETNGRLFSMNEEAFRQRVVTDLQLASNFFQEGNGRQ